MTPKTNAPLLAAAGLLWFATVAHAQGSGSARCLARAKPATQRLQLPQIELKFSYNFSRLWLDRDQFASLAPPAETSAILIWGPDRFSRFSEKDHLFVWLTLQFWPKDPVVVRTRTPDEVISVSEKNQRVIASVARFVDVTLSRCQQNTSKTTSARASA